LADATQTGYRGVLSRRNNGGTKPHLRVSGLPFLPFSLAGSQFPREAPMSDKPILVDLKKLREIISGLELKDAKTKEYIEARWLNYVG
jgi:hypothetical protein